jgi:hypothetical protein
MHPARQGAMDQVAMGLSRLLLSTASARTSAARAAAVRADAFAAAIARAAELVARARGFARTWVAAGTRRGGRRRRQRRGNHHRRRHQQNGPNHKENSIPIHESVLFENKRRNNTTKTRPLGRLINPARRTVSPGVGCVRAAQRRPTLASPCPKAHGRPPRNASGSHRPKDAQAGSLPTAKTRPAGCRDNRNAASVSIGRRHRPFVATPSRGPSNSNIQRSSLDRNPSRPRRRNRPGSTSAAIAAPRRPMVEAEIAFAQPYSWQCLIPWGRRPCRVVGRAMRPPRHPAIRVSLMVL